MTWSYQSWYYWNLMCWIEFNIVIVCDALRCFWTQPGRGSHIISICPCPISSSRGVSSPCCHPFHRECWDRFANGRRGASCDTCKTSSEKFVVVFMATDSNATKMCQKRGSLVNFYPKAWVEQFPQLTVWNQPILQDWKGLPWHLQIYTITFSKICMTTGNWSIKKWLHPST